MIKNRLTDEVKREPPWTMLFADDIVICEDTREEVEQRLESWRNALERRGMKVSRSKTEYLCINGRHNNETMKMEDKKVPSVRDFKYQQCKKVVVVRRRSREECRQDGTDGKKYRE